MRSDNPEKVANEFELGRYLRNVRESSGISLEQVQKETKIRIKYLAAIEEGDFSQIPGGDVYVKGFLQNYSKAVGLESSKVLDIYKQIRPKEESDHQVTSGSINHSPHKNNYIQIIAIGIAVIVFITVSTFFLKKPLETTLPDDKDHIEVQKSENNAYAKKEPEASTQEISENEEKNKAVVELEENSDIKSLYIIKDDKINVVLEVVSDRCWISVKRDNVLDFEGILNKGDTKILDATDEVNIRVGNPLVIKFTVNNNDIGILGGKTRDIIFRRGA